MKRFLIQSATALFKLLYLVTYRLFGPRKQFTCLSRQSNGTTEDFEIIRSYVQGTMPDYRVLILAKQIDNLPLYALHMIRQVVAIARSEVVFLDSYCIVVSLLRDTIHAPVVQMWHAMGDMKRFGYSALDTAEGRTADEARLWHMHEGYTSAIISSLVFGDHFADGFNIDKSILFECPLPKADLLVDPEHRARERKKLYHRYPQLIGKKNIVYCPTFRKPRTHQDDEALESLVSSIDFDRYNVILKAHPIAKLHVDDGRVIQDLPADANILYAADYVVSDYSTIIYEAGLAEVPVYLYTYDWELYRERRGLNIDIERDVPAPHARTARELVNLIEHDAFDAAQYSKFIRTYVKVPQGGNYACTRRLVEHARSLHC